MSLLGKVKSWVERDERIEIVGGVKRERKLIVVGIKLELWNNFV